MESSRSDDMNQNAYVGGPKALPRGFLQIPVVNLPADTGENRFLVVLVPPERSKGARCRSLVSLLRAARDEFQCKAKAFGQARSRGARHRSLVSLLQAARDKSRCKAKVSNRARSRGGRCLRPVAGQLLAMVWNRNLV